MKKLLFTLLSLFFLHFIYAQQDTLLQHYRQMALNYQQRIKMAEHQVSGAESSVDAASSDRLPQLDFKSRYSYFGVPMKQAPTDIGVPGEDLHNFYSLNLDLYQPVLTGGYLKNTQRAAEYEVEMMKSLVDMSKQDIMLNSDMAYWRAVSKRETYRLQQKYMETIGKFLKVIQDRVDEEIVGMNELFQAKVRYNNAEYRVIMSEKDYKVSVMDLNRLIGLPAGVTANVADSLTIIIWIKANDTITQTALEQRPEINYIKSQILKNEMQEKVIGSQYNPQFGITAGGKWGSPSPGLEIEPGFNYYLKAKLTVPIFHWNKKHQEVFSMRQQTEIARLQMEETKDRVRLEVESNYYKLEKSQEQFDFASGSLDNAAQNVSVIIDRYNEGLSSVLEVLDAQLDWQKTYMNFIVSKYQLNIAYSQYLYAIGEFSLMAGN
jgi:outer membrane protein TolC